MTFETIVTQYRDINSLPDTIEDGVFIHGLFLEGAAWETSDGDGYLIDQRPKELHFVMPIIKVVALEISQKSSIGKYICPVYYTTQRGPTYIFSADMKMES